MSNLKLPEIWLFFACVLERLFALLADSTAVLDLVLVIPTRVVIFLATVVVVTGGLLIASET